MRKKSIFPLSLLIFLFTILFGCNSDSSEEPVSFDGKETAIIYHLLDKNGKETTIFSYGDKILFELIVTNTTNHTLIFDDESDFVKKVFVVYNSEGQPFNPIISKTLIYRKQPVTIAPGEKFKRCLIWPWDLVPLPRGKYISPCTIDIEEICNETYTANFEII